MECKNVCNLPETLEAHDEDGILIMQNGKAVKMFMSVLRAYIGYASGADVLGVPAPSLSDAGKVPAVNPTGNGYTLIAPPVKNALPKSGGAMTGPLTVNKLVLTKGVDYGDTLPAAGTPGRIFFKKV